MGVYEVFFLNFNLADGYEASSLRQVPQCVDLRFIHISLCVLYFNTIRRQSRL